MLQLYASIATELTDGGMIHGTMRFSNIGLFVTSQGGLWVFEHVLGELN